MKRSDLEKYYLSIAPIRSMYEQGLLTDDEYLKSEQIIADKYCIKDNNLYRLNDLTNALNKVIYSVTKEEVGEVEKDNKSKHVTKIT